MKGAAIAQIRCWLLRVAGGQARCACRHVHSPHESGALSRSLRAALAINALGGVHAAPPRALYLPVLDIQLSNLIMCS